MTEKDDPPAGGGTAGQESGAGTPEESLDRLAEDWIAVWQSEISALAMDREIAEAWTSWAATAATWMRAMTAAPGTAASAPSTAGFPGLFPFPATASASGPFPWAMAGMTQSGYLPGFPWMAPGAGTPQQPSPGGPPHDGSDAPPRSATADDAPQPGADAGHGGPGSVADTDADRLRRRLVELEQRLAGLESDVAERAGGAKPDRRGPRRRRPSA
ncbi:hypothetical protein ACFOD4_02990 [Pseudoroseomonas globiformis]|uniref:Poly(3-hydroxyalkanoate) polymerase subunit PhaE n=1 Tax=Teichococcus globiformis TaxID=2307229 RepID=A0ABV7G004_9PROT